MKWNITKNHIPTSAKVMPVWIRSIDNYVDLVWLTEDEKYFVSVDHKRVYQIEGNIIYWTIVDLP